MQYSEFLENLKKSSNDVSKLKVLLDYNDKTILDRIEEFRKNTALNIKLGNDGCENDRDHLTLIQKYLVGLTIHRATTKETPSQVRALEQLKENIQKTIDIKPKKAAFPADPNAAAAQEWASSLEKKQNTNAVTFGDEIAIFFDKSKAPKKIGKEIFVKEIGAPPKGEFPTLKAEEQETGDEGEKAPPKPNYPHTHEEMQEAQRMKREMAALERVAEKREARKNQEAAAAAANAESTSPTPKRKVGVVEALRGIFEKPEPTNLAQTTGKSAEQLDPNERGGKKK